MKIHKKLKDNKFQIWNYKVCQICLLFYVVLSETMMSSQQQSKKKLTSCPRSLIKIIFPGVPAAGNLPVVS